MAALRRSPALTSLALFAAAAPAQGIVVNGSSFSYGHSRGGNSLTLSAGNGYGFGLSPYSFGRSRVTVIYSGYSGSQTIVVPIVLQPRTDDTPDDAAPDTPPRRSPRQRRDQPADAPAAPDAPPPGQNAGVFRPLAPDNRERARRPVEPDVPLPPPEELPPAAAPPGATLVERGRVAFAADEFGRAADHFRRAAAADPADPVPAFLLAQALVALGKYTAAAETVRAAADRFPNWTALPIRPLDVYGPHAADYSAHLKLLDQTRAAHPDDPALLFLSGHVLWFDGHRDEARALFRRAVPDFPAAERYLRAAPATL
jgi:hypothetical protein